MEAIDVAFHSCGANGHPLLQKASSCSRTDFLQPSTVASDCIGRDSSYFASALKIGCPWVETPSFKSHPKETTEAGTIFTGRHTGRKLGSWQFEIGFGGRCLGI